MIVESEKCGFYQMLLIHLSFKMEFELLTCISGKFKTRETHRYSCTAKVIQAMSCLLYCHFIKVNFTAN